MRYLGFSPRTGADSIPQLFYPVLYAPRAARYGLRAGYIRHDPHSSQYAPVTPVEQEPPPTLCNLYTSQPTSQYRATTDRLPVPRTPNYCRWKRPLS